MRIANSANGGLDLTQKTKKIHASHECLEADGDIKDTISETALIVLRLDASFTDGPNAGSRAASSQSSDRLASLNPGHGVATQPCRGGKRDAACVSASRTGTPRETNGCSRDAATHNRRSGCSLDSTMRIRCHCLPALRGATSRSRVPQPPHGVAQQSAVPIARRRPADECGGAFAAPQEGRAPSEAKASAHCP